MAEDQIKKVFDEFYKVDVTTSDYKSSGLGLAICKRIIEKHDGKIWVESPGPGKGSTFYFTLKSWDEK
jgi:signal transduction histidine kinase